MPSQQQPLAYHLFSERSSLNSIINLRRPFRYVEFKSDRVEKNKLSNPTILKAMPCTIRRSSTKRAMTPIEITGWVFNPIMIVLIHKYTLIGIGSLTVNSSTSACVAFLSCMERLLLPQGFDASGNGGRSHRYLPCLYLMLIRNGNLN